MLTFIALSLISLSAKAECDKKDLQIMDVLDENRDLVVEAREFSNAYAIAYAAARTGTTSTQAQKYDLDQNGTVLGNDLSGISRFWSRYVEDYRRQLVSPDGKILGCAMNAIRIYYALDEGKDGVVDRADKSNAQRYIDSW